MIAQSQAATEVSRIESSHDLSERLSRRVGARQLDLRSHRLRKMRLVVRGREPGLNCPSPLLWRSGKSVVMCPTMMQKTKILDS